MRKNVRTGEKPFAARSAGAASSPTRCALWSAIRAAGGASPIRSSARASTRSSSVGADAPTAQLGVHVAVADERGAPPLAQVHHAREASVELDEPRVTLEVDRLPLLAQLRLRPVGPP